MTSFTFRITCRFALLVTATTAAVLIVGGFLLDREIEHGLELLHDIEVRELGELIGTNASLDAEAIANRIKHDADGDAALFVIQVANFDGDLLFRSENLGEAILPMDAAQGTHWTTRLPFGRVHVSCYTVGAWKILIGSPLEPSERLLRDYARMCVPLVLAVGLLSMALGYAFSRATLKPIRAIEATANRIRADNLAERIPVPSGRDELAALTQLLNQMFDRLQSSFDQVRRFTADASHELKTPLALIRLNAEKLRPRLGTDADALAALGDILEEITRLHQVIDRLLFLAKSESGALTLAARTIEMQPMITAFAEDAEALAEDRGVRFALGQNESGEIQGEPDLLRQLLLNLIANAVAATPRGSVVTLDSFRAEQEWRLVISDEGPGIPETHLPQIFERFVRFERPTDAAGVRVGHGLGLAISKSIVQLHRGTIRAENRTDRSGLRLIVALPVSEAGQ
jgi:signal transduction histidine kinase